MIQSNIKNFIQKSCNMTCGSFRYTSSGVNKTLHVTPTNNSQVEFNDIKISTKLQNKLPPREPIAKNFFVGQLDKEMLAFPEVIPRDDMNKLQEEIKESQKYFEQTDNMSVNYITDLKKLGLFGLTVPQHLGGKGYFVSESFIASESENKKLEIALSLQCHRVVIDIINEFGTEDQRMQLLPKLASGSCIATEALYESVIDGKQFFNTTAEFDAGTGEWILNGEKSFIVNGTDANLFLVFAQTRTTAISGDQQDGITIFIVDESLPGIQKSEPLKVFGNNTTKQCSLTFQKTSLMKTNILGQPNAGNEIAQKFLQLSRLRMSSIIVRMMTKITEQITNYCINTKHSGVPMTEIQSIGNRLSPIIGSTYASESMMYYITGLVDEFDKQDVDMEAAILKLYSLENLWKAATFFMEFMGPKSLISGDFFESTLKDATQLYVQGEPLDSLRLFIGLSGLQHAGMAINDIVKKERNPLFNPGHILKSFFDRNSIDSPKVSLNLGDDLHPSLVSPAYWLEQSIARLEIGTQTLLSRHGNEIIEKHVEIMRLAECVQLIFAMFASLSRASRSYCIGLKHSDYEMLIATTLCLKNSNHVKSLITDITSGPFMTNDINYQKIAKQTYKSHGYFLEHPLKYNF